MARCVRQLSTRFRLMSASMFCAVRWGCRMSQQMISVRYLATVVRRGERPHIVPASDGAGPHGTILLIALLERLDELAGIEVDGLGVVRREQAIGRCVVLMHLVPA